MCRTIVAAATAAVSARRTLGPSDIGTHPRSVASSASSLLIPPSGPTSNEISSALLRLGRHSELVSSASSQAKILAWEEADETNSLWRPNLSSADEISLLVGPEGGINKEEADEATERGWVPMSLGPRVLRAETAAVAAATIVLHTAGELG